MSYWPKWAQIVLALALSDLLVTYLGFPKFRTIFWGLFAAAAICVLMTRRNDMTRTAKFEVPTDNTTIVVPPIYGTFKTDHLRKENDHTTGENQ